MSDDCFGPHERLFDISSSYSIIAEAKLTASLILPRFDFSHFDSALQDVERIFSGKCEGFAYCSQGANT